MFFRMLLGHVMGDYLMQPLKMAQNKSPKKPLTEGSGVPFKTAIFWSTFHSVMYSLCMCLWLWHLTPLVFALIFMTHWPIDFLGLADKYLKLIGGRTMKQASEDTSNFRSFNIAFTAIVYTVVDNGMHLMLMYPIVVAIERGVL